MLYPPRSVKTVESLTTYVLFNTETLIGRLFCAPPVYGTGKPGHPGLFGVLPHVDAGEGDARAEIPLNLRAELIPVVVRRALGHVVGSPVIHVGIHIWQRQGRQNVRRHWIDPVRRSPLAGRRVIALIDVVTRKRETDPARVGRQRVVNDNCRPAASVSLEKSPFRSAAVGRLEVAVLCEAVAVAFGGEPEKVLSSRSGPPTEPP